MLQNVVGALLAAALGQPALMGVLAGSVTLTGGPATGLAFAPQFEAAGVPRRGHARASPRRWWGSSPAASSAARRHLAHRAPPAATPTTAARVRHAPIVTAQSIVEQQMPRAASRAPAGEDREAYAILKTLVVMLVAMWIGG